MTSEQNASLVRILIGNLQKSLVDLHTSYMLQIFLGNSDEIKSKLLLPAKANVYDSFKNSDRNFDSCKKAANFAYYFLAFTNIFLSILS
jgi:hypothetical protein